MRRQASLRPIITAFLVESLWLIFAFIWIGLKLLFGRSVLRMFLKRVDKMLDTRFPLLCGLLIKIHEKDVLKFVNRVLKNGGNFIDAGAYHGHFTIYVSDLLKNYQSTIVAIEPNPANFNVLRERAPCDTRVVLINRAVWVNDGQTVFITAENTGEARIYIQPSSSDQKTIGVKTVRLDSLIDGLSLETVKLIKLDIQGAEYEILTDPAFDTSKIENMVIEVHYNYKNFKSREIIYALQQKGFDIVPIHPDERYNNWYLLATKKKQDRKI